MEFLIEILRQSDPWEKPYFQTFSYETEEEKTVAAALMDLNERENLRDSEGNAAKPIAFDCGCLQKKCGACAMVINGKPALACEVRLSEAGERIRLEPLKKFPIVRDLIADRSIMRENLKKMELWLKGEAESRDFKTEFEASRCLQCGCCLEVCPNFYSGGSFTGMAGAVPMTRILFEMPKTQAKEASDLYKKHVYEGCGKSLSCRNVCPAKIDIDKLLVNSNAVAVWKRQIKKPFKETEK